MRERGTVRGDVTVAEEYYLYGTIVDSVTVHDTGDFHVHGAIDGSVTVLPGATVHLNGTVNGHVMSQGTLIVSGVLNGAVKNLSGVVLVESGGIVG